jgi:hypothetical protein
LLELLILVAAEAAVDTLQDILLGALAVLV